MDEHREVLYAADVAKLRGISGRAARGWLASLEAEAGSHVRRVGNKLCISRRAFDRLMPGAAGTPPVSVEGQLKQLNEQVQAIARTVMELREQGDDSAEGVQTARRSIHELREALQDLTTKKSTQTA
jgi:septation ring formation regulator EzrA